MNNSLVSKEKKIESYLFFLVGLTSTWTAIQIPVFGIQISIFNLIVIIAAIYHLLKINHSKFYVRNLFLFLFVIGTIVSCFSCLIFLNKYWFSESFKATMKFIMVFLPLLCLYNSLDIKYFGKYFFIGLYYSCIVQLGWSILQLIFWYKLNRVLNQEFFGDFLHIQTSHSWLTWHSGFRTTGLSWESANLGISLVIGFFLSKNFWMKVAFFTGLIFCGSRSALLTLLFSLFVTFIYRIFFVNNKIKFNKGRAKKTFLIILMLALVGIISLKFINFDFSIFTNTLKTFTERISNGFSGDDASAGRHMDYYFKLPDVLKKSNIFQIFFGYGTSCSGFPYTSIFNKSNDPAYVWNVESDIITVLVGNGIFGFITYYTFSIQMLSKNRKKDFDQCAAAISIIFAGIMYLYVRTWVTLVLVFLASNVDFPKYKCEYKGKNKNKCNNIPKIIRRFFSGTIKKITLEYRTTYTKPKKR